MKLFRKLEYFYWILQIFLNRFKINISWLDEDEVTNLFHLIFRFALITLKLYPFLTTLFWAHLNHDSRVKTQTISRYSWIAIFSHRKQNFWKQIIYFSSRANTSHHQRYPIINSFHTFFKWCSRGFNNWKLSYTYCFSQCRHRWFHSHWSGDGVECCWV